MLAEQAERSLEDQTHELQRKEADLMSVKNYVLELEQQIARLNHRSRSNHVEMNSMQVTIASLGREKDSLQHSVDDKTKRVALLEGQVIDKVSPTIPRG